jgi:hypothetical protein
MTTQERLEQQANRYREQGYRVVLNPGPDDLPPFAKDFKVEILATRADGGVIASAKSSLADFENDRNLSRYAEIIQAQPRWRYDVAVLGPPPTISEFQGVDEASEAEIAKGLDDAEFLLHSGFRPQAVLAAWAAMESAMRHRLRAMGERAEWGSSPQSMLNELYSSGVLTPAEFRSLEGLSRLRNIIVHGFSVPEISAETVLILTNTARKLLTESKQVETAS